MAIGIDSPVRATDAGGGGRRPEQAAVVLSAFRPTLPVVAAQATGAFREAALTVTVRAAASSDQQLKQLLAGEIGVAHTALDNVVGWSAVAPVRVIAIVDLGVAHQLVARHPINAVDRLRGAAIGVDSSHNGLVTLLQSALHAAGVKPGEYALRAIGGLDQRERALASGEIDACLLAGGVLTRALEAGQHQLLAIRDHFPRYPAIALIAGHPVDPERRSVLARYVAALHAATRITAVDSAAVAAILGTAPAQAAAWLAAERARMTGIVSDHDGARTVITDALVATGRIAPGGPIDGFIDLLMEETRDVSAGPATPVAGTSAPQPPGEPSLTAAHPASVALKERR